MPTIKHLFLHIEKYGRSHRSLYAFSTVMLFVALFDGIICYIAPLVITESGISKTMMGIIIGSASIVGAVFDFLMCRIFKNNFYRRILIFMFAICLLQPLILWQAKTFPVFLLAMAMWGIYYDLKNFACFDFVSRETGKDEHSSSFGVIQVFQSIGYFIAPIAAGVVIGEFANWAPFATAWILISLAIVSFLILIFLKRKQPEKDIVESDYACKRFNLFMELSVWRKIGKLIMPALVLTLLINTVDGFFWTIGPILAEGFLSQKMFAGFMMAAYTLPPLFVGWFVGYFTAKFGKKRTAFFSFFIGSIILAFLPLTNSLFHTTIIIFLSSTFIALSWPAINGAYADYISESRLVEKEIEGLEDFYTNIGYIIGPISAGFLADRFGNMNAFSVLGIAGALLAFILLKFTPRKINIKPKMVLEPDIMN